MRIRIDLNEDAATRLMNAAALARRPIPWQAEVLLLKALGVFNRDSKSGSHDVVTAEEGGSNAA